MNIALRAILVAMAAVVVALTMWVVTPSSMFFNPVSLSLNGNVVTLIRDTPFGEVRVNWIGEITLLDQGHFECGGYGSRVAQVEESGVLTSKIGAWANPCLEAGPPFILRYQWQVLLFGIIPLRPTGISIRVDAETVES